MVQVKFKNSLSLMKDEYSLVNAVAESVKEQLNGVDLSTIKYNAQLVNDICTCIENSCFPKKGKKKVDKKIVVLKVFTVLFGEDVDLNVVDEMIEFAHENKLIHKKTLLRSAYKLLRYFFSTK
jgi:hypothetical protein